MILALGLFLQAFVRSNSMGAILTGAGAPSSGTGSDGDYYYNLSSPLNMYGPKAAGAWPAPVNLLGTTGLSLNDATSAGMTFTPAHNGVNHINAASGSDLVLEAGGNAAIHISSTGLGIGEPLAGNGAPLTYKQQPLVFAAADITLNATQQGCPVLECSGTTGNIISPSGEYTVNNLLSVSSRLIKTSVSAGASIAASKITRVYYSAAAADFKIISVSP